MNYFLITSLLVLSCQLANSQDFNSMAGDWMRINAEYSDGKSIERNHHARFFLRFHFTDKKVYQLIGSNCTPSNYSRQGNLLKIEPTRTFAIEQYTSKSLTLLEPEGEYQLRYHFVPLDSFQRMGRKYNFTVNNTDTVYNEATGLEPIFSKGSNEWMQMLITGTSGTFAAKFNFVVKKDGTIGDVEITVTTDPKLNKRLTQAIKKSSGKWIPATLHGKPVNVKVNGSGSFKH
jgi:hypothetical protein